MARILLQFVHPALERSRVNQALLGAARETGDVTVNDLYELYPQFNIDVAREQSLMEDHDSFVFQFPLYWYSSPSLLKEWFDLVLQYGWAYGQKGRSLVGKRARLAVTTGGSATSYSREGHNRHTMAEILRPLEATMRTCGMEYGHPFVTHNALHLEGAALAQTTEQFRSWLLED